jgi:threonine aldolase
MNFRSDNILGCPPAILDAIARVNDTPTHPYGHDPMTARLNPRFSELFEHEAFVFPVSSGTAANGLSLAVVTPPWGVVFCHRLAHIVRDEWCAPEFFTGGARLLTVAGPAAKITPDLLDAQVRLTTHAGKPSTLSVTEATEAGTVYTLDELGALAEVAQRHALHVQMDGARFANALVALGCSPADLSWRLGVDALSFGATKNGTLTAEAVVVFRKELADELAHRRKRAGQVSSKMRFFSAQLEAYLTDDLWLTNARAANDSARRLGEGLRSAGLQLAAPVDANLVFPRVPLPLRDRLRAQGFEFLDWPALGDDVVRLVCGFATPDANVDALVAACRG